MSSDFKDEAGQSLLRKGGKLLSDQSYFAKMIMDPDKLREEVKIFNEFFDLLKEEAGNQAEKYFLTSIITIGLGAFAPMALLGLTTYNNLRKVENTRVFLKEFFKRTKITPKGVLNLTRFIFYSQIYFHIFFKGIPPKSSMIRIIFSKKDNNCFLNVVDEAEDNHKNGTLNYNAFLWHLSSAFKNFGKDTKSKKFAYNQNLLVKTVKNLAELIYESSVTDEMEKTNGLKKIKKLEGTNYAFMADNQPDGYEETKEYKTAFESVDFKDLMLHIQKLRTENSEETKKYAEKAKQLLKLLKTDRAFIEAVLDYAVSVIKLKAKIKAFVTGHMDYFIKYREKVLRDYPGKNNYWRRRRIIETYCEEGDLIPNLVTEYNLLVSDFLELEKTEKEIIDSLKLRIELEQHYKLGLHDPLKATIKGIRGVVKLGDIMEPLG